MHTVLRACQRLLCTCAGEVDPSLKAKQLVVRNRDVEQIFPQTKIKRYRRMFVRPNCILGYPSNFLFENIYQTYGLPESPISWFMKYHSHHKGKYAYCRLSMIMCFIYTPKCLFRSHVHSKVFISFFAIFNFSRGEWSVSRPMTVPTHVTRNSRISENA